MGTFHAPFPGSRPIFHTAGPEFSSTTASADAEFSSMLTLLAMQDDVGACAPIPADAAPLPAFFPDGHDQQPLAGVGVTMPPQIFVDAMVTPSRVHGFPAAGHEATNNGASRPAKRKRWPQTTRSPPSDDSAGSGGQAQVPAAADRARARRRVWVRERSTEWWDRLDAPACPDAEFRRAFRMSRATFSALCDALGGAVAKEDTALRAAVPVRRRVAACLWRLATGEPLREVSRRFGLGISTCHSIVLQVCHALATVLKPGAIFWPDAPAAAVAARFEAASGIPGVVGAVCTTRVPIVAPKANVAAYYDRRLTTRNQKASYSVAVQAVADAHGAFTDVFISHGSLSDAALLARSALCAGRGESSGLLGGQQWLVGGASYPLTDWMLVPYAHRNLTWAEHKFNERVAAARGAARGAIRRLKARWRCLQRRTEVKMQDLPNLIDACCVLHNICERAGEGLDPDLMQYEVDDDEDGVVPHDDVPSAMEAQERDRIAHGLLHGNHANDGAF
ncbi:protein ANTAGONIST OF LIKE HETEROCHROMATIN PROTEIN 1-like [Setaria italica]|uniref:protein ANTAGONIST OF LIKE HETEROCHROMATIN PROTEIN 1-like n=1 Tax=Setaria italica TaxID=4555 RepID=UPI000BE5E69C|nr:protein ANTAGONIST OF LIKE HETEROCHROMATIN PROTEIN 1-like [Setaria italica]